MLIMFVMSVMSVLGCRADDPSPGQYDGGRTDQKQADFFQNCPSPSPLKVSIKGYVNPTCYTIQPFQGLAQGADHIVAQGGAGTAPPAKVNAVDGSFCIEVQLLPNALNNIVFSPIDHQGCMGVPTSKTIQHHSCSQPDAGTSQVNIALGASVSSSEQPSQGQGFFLVDGNPSTVVTYTGGWGWSDAKLFIGLGFSQQVAVHRIIVRWRDAKGGGGCDYGESYDVAVSAFSNPGKDLKSGAWTMIQEVKNGDGGTDSFTVPAAQAKNVALLLHTDGCVGWSEKFALAELEVWAIDPGSVPPPPRCP